MRTPHGLWLVPVFLFLGLGAVAAFFAAEEIKTSKLQASYFSSLGKEINFRLGPGPNPSFSVPAEGPYNHRLGYSYLPAFTKMLEAHGYVIERQARTSQRYNSLLRLGAYPIYKPKTVAGIEILDRYGQLLYKASYPSRIFPSFEAIPPLLVKTLLHIENRELLDPGPVTRNPVIEWKRLLFAVFGQLMQKAVTGFNAGGGSTLAIQTEKFRYSPGGQTTDAREKLRQILSASLRVYLDGSDTRENRKKIILDYLNSTPLSARPGFGEINSIGDGLWAWFGRELEDVSRALNLEEQDSTSLQIKALAFREVLSLIMAQRRPTYYLAANHAALDDLTDAETDRLANASIISPALRAAVHSARLRFMPAPPPPPQTAFLDQKAANALRTHLLGVLGLKNLYELDRIDLTAVSTLDQETQRKVMDFLKRMNDPEFVKSIGMFGFRLLSPENDVAKIKWSVVLFERGADGNRLRIQADNIDGPFDMNEGVKLDLGSTAKLRTLATYLEIVSELHRRYAGLAEEDLRAIADEAPDALTAWATAWLIRNPDASPEEMLNAAMERKYSASPHETFFTGGGIHNFVNFEKSDNGKVMSVREALRNSVNLVFIRIMRDIVNYTIGQGSQTREELLGDPGHPARKAYLERYAEKEGAVFLNRYMNEYAGLSPDEALEKASRRARGGVTAQTVLFRSVRPKAGFAAYSEFMKKNSKASADESRLAKLYRDYPAERYNLADRGYITGINPLELWLLGFKEANPGASRNKIMAASLPVRIESYSWLFSPRKTGAQNTRIRILLEQDAFSRIHKRWSRLGYPFERLVPSYATAIGSSADRPGALAELMGIIMNDGIKKPILRFDKIHFAKDTPFETVLAPDGNNGVQVLDPAIAHILRASLADVVENGTAKRLRGAYLDSKGDPLVIGGKTGTGDHRYDEFAAGGRLISSRVKNRTGTIVFFIGDRFFGTVTAHVSGEAAADYKFTSALSAQMLKSLAPVLQPLIASGIASAAREISPSYKQPDKLPIPGASKTEPEEAEPNEGGADTADEIIDSQNGRKEEEEQNNIDDTNEKVY